jgi:hypothetical protein
MSEQIILEQPAHTKINSPGLLYDVLLINTAEILAMVGSYYYSKRGKVHNLRIDKRSIEFESQKSGSFSIFYNVSFTQGCQDLTYDEDAKMLITFNVNQAHNQIELRGEEFLERGPDEF